MPNSKYPNQLDTSVEIPPVRDNITEIGSDVINSLRSAIFKIESTLGINPQGAPGNSVSLRLSKSIDDNGNILKEALDRANILSGPILDSDVSKTAAIKESKLKLDFPTQILQDEISILNSTIETIESALEEISTRLSIHLNPSAINSHKANAISVDAAAVLASNTATLSLEADTLQSTLENIYNSHINYTGVNISTTNNSHQADQIFYDNTLTSSVIFSNSVQGALDELTNARTLSFNDSLVNTSSNGRIRAGKINDGYENSETGSRLLIDSSATYTLSSGLSTTTFSLSTPTSPIEDIKEFDILTLSGSSVTSDNKEYQIKSVTLDGLGLVTSIEVYGGPKGLAASGLTISVFKNPYITYNSAGFSTTSRPRANKTNTPDVQVLNPDSATVITSGIRPENITSTNHTFDISIDGGSPLNISTYSPSYTDPSLDSIIQTINDQVVDQHLNFTAYKVRVANCYELAISHNLPNFSGDNKNRTIKISAGSSDDGTSELGFSSSLDLEIEGSSGNSLNLNGKVLKGFGLIQTFTDATLEIISGTLTASLYSGTFAELGVRIGDLFVLDGSTVSSDDGTYRVGSITGATVNLDLAGSNFSGSMDDGSRVYIIRATAPVGEFTFEEISGIDGTILFDVFLSEDKNIFQTKRLEIEGSISSGPFSAVISDVSKNFILSGQTAILEVSTTGYATLENPTTNTGSPVFVGTTGTYKVFASDGLSFITLQVEASGPPTILLNKTIYGFGEISKNNYNLCRGSFATSLGRILGDSSDPGIPALIDKRTSGTVDHTVVGDVLLEKYIEGPRSEIRSSGIIRGFEVVDSAYISGSPDYQTFSVSAGVAMVNGVRFEFSGLENIKIPTDQTYIVAVDGKGCILAAPYITDPTDPTKTISPFFELDVAYLSEVSNDGTNTTEIDLRLFIDHLDFKVLGDIKVSTDSRNGHFTDLSKAVQYSKRFRKMFPKLSPPSILIENGEYIIDEVIAIDFDLNISGAGNATILTKGPTLGVGKPLVSGKFDMTSSMFLIGIAPDTYSNEINTGVTFSNFTYKSSDLIVDVGTAIAIAQPVISFAYSNDATFRFENINFQGSENISAATTTGEYALYIGQQNLSTLSPITSRVFGNIIFKNCRLNNMGLEYGAIKVIEDIIDTLIKNVIISNNIVTKGSPNELDTSAIVFQYPVSTVYQNIVEVGNTFQAS